MDRSLLEGRYPAKEWAKLLTGRDLKMMPATLAYDDGTVTLTVPGATLTALAMPGAFPDYKQIVPAELTTCTRPVR